MEEWISCLSFSKPPIIPSYCISHSYSHSHSHYPHYLLPLDIPSGPIPSHKRKHPSFAHTSFLNTLIFLFITLNQLSPKCCHRPTLIVQTFILYILNLSPLVGPGAGAQCPSPCPYALHPSALSRLAPTSKGNISVS